MRTPHVVAGESAESPMRSLTQVTPIRPTTVIAAAATNDAPMPTARARLRSSTQTNRMSLCAVPAITRTAVRSEPTAPSAAPISATIEMIPAIEKDTGSSRSAGSMIPSFPIRPGTTDCTASMMAFQACGLPASHSAATEKPRRTPAKTLNRAR
jgi:hypothetical protein